MCLFVVTDPRWMPLDLFLEPQLVCCLRDPIVSPIALVRV